MKRATLVGIMVLGLAATANSKTPAAGLPALAVSSDGHHLVTLDGRPFFWLGDTAWLLFTRSPQEIEHYLDDRARKGFSVIQVMAIRTDLQNGQLCKSGRGDLPFARLDPVELNESYWKHIDFIVDQAARRGLYVVLFTMWGRYVDRLFPNPRRDLYDYGRLLGRRYHDRHQVLWAVCGEYEKINPHWKQDPTVNAAQKELIRRLAAGLNSTRAPYNLMTIHPIYTSARDFHNDSWLDFNMQQTWGHIAPDVVRIGADYRRRPPKPVLVGEPGYENRPQGDCPAWHLRLEAYWSVLSGGFGFTYGAHGLWQFGPEWRRALAFPGASQMQYIRKLIQSRPVLKAIPCSNIVAEKPGSLSPRNPSRIVALRATDGSYAIFYTPQGRPISVDMSMLSGTTVNAWWYSPRDGKCYDAEGIATAEPFGRFAAANIYRFAPPGKNGLGFDWVLVLDNAARQFLRPGTTTAGDKVE